MERGTKNELIRTILIIPITFLSIFLSYNLCTFIIFTQREILFKNSILITSLGLDYSFTIFAILIFYILSNIISLIIEIKKFYPDITKRVKKIVLPFFILLLLVAMNIMHYIRIDDTDIYYNRLLSIKEMNINFNKIQSVEIYAARKRNSTRHKSYYFSPVMDIKTINTKIDVWRGGRFGAPKNGEIIHFLNILKENHITININNNFNNEMVRLLNRRKDRSEIIKIFNFSK
ncbi:hypothetical protein FACS1894172_01540 [Spirochaetia bacterium]|nr:hypothetical protein FACS1894164_04640 [Spirochaetia bacterium]GHU29747.1 hypothetical protein FACS1894172_01540 [Spirochaetia bacterium]